MLGLTYLFFFFLDFGRNARLGFGFPSTFTASYGKQHGRVKFSCFTYLLSDPWQMVYDDHSAA